MDLLNQSFKNLLLNSKDDQVNIEKVNDKNDFSIVNQLLIPV